MKRFVIALLVLVVLIMGGLKIWLIEDDAGTGATDKTATVVTDRSVRLEVGLDKTQAAYWHHTDEGSGFLPLSFFYALNDADTGKPFIDILPRFGLVPDHSRPGALPIGLTVGHPDMSPGQAQYLGINCAACHSGMYTYRGTAMVIDGAPNMLDFEKLLDALKRSLLVTLDSPEKMFQMISIIMQREHDPNTTGELFEVHPDTLRLFTAVSMAGDDQPLTALRHALETGLHDAYHGAAELRPAKLEKLADRIEDLVPDDAGWSKDVLRDARADLAQFHKDLDFIEDHTRRLLKLKDSYAGETPAGPGRADSFDAIWDLLVQKHKETPMIAPVSIPHLFDYTHFTWIHWDGNTSTVLQRDYAQAIALGANYDQATSASSVLAHDVIKLEETARHIDGPRWPEDILGPIDHDKARRGAALFASHCRSCHGQESLTQVARVGTDPRRAENYARLQQGGKSYAELLSELGDAVVHASLTAHDIDPSALAPIERSPTPRWRITHAYHSRPLKGIWASPPYLHNGSVPTLWDLLQPAANRPRTFLVGREYDPVHVGINATRQPDGGWTFDTGATGNANRGHEYANDLSDAQRGDLVEYLKTL